MASTSIEWTDVTWNPVRGCVKVSPGCANCYAETFAERWRGVKGHPYEQGFDLRLVPEKLTEPLSWKKPRRVFVNSMSDLFQDGVPDGYIDQVFAVMALTPQHTYQLLTKRPTRMREYCHDIPLGLFGAFDRAAYENGVTKHARDWETDTPITWPLPHVWLGVSVENQHFADERIPLLLQTPAAVRFVSAEPLLETIDISRHLRTARAYGFHPNGNPKRMPERDLVRLDWVIVGGESGPGARPFDLSWARSIVQQCKEAGVPVFVKQLGADAVDGKLSNVELVLGGAGRPRPFGQPLSEAAATEIVGEFGWMNRKVPLRDRKGGEMTEWPADLQVREFPQQPTR